MLSQVESGSVGFKRKTCSAADYDRDCRRFHRRVPGGSAPARGSTLDGAAESIAANSVTETSERAEALKHSCPRRTHTD